MMNPRRVNRPLKKLTLFFVWAFTLVIISAGKSAKADEVRLFENATDAPHLSLIDSAKKSIDIEIYTLNDFQIRLAILDSIKRGVRVRILQETTPVGTVCRPFEPQSNRDPRDCLETKKFIDQVRSLGGVYSPFNYESLCRAGVDCFQHGKVLIVDERLALISTGNFDPASFCNEQDLSRRCNRDYSVIIDNESYVHALIEIFEYDLMGKSYDLGRLLSALKVPALTVSPLSEEPLLRFIRSAQKSILYQNQYLSDSRVASALSEASARGVRVEILLASICSFSRPTNTDRRHLLAVSDYFIKNGINAHAFTSKTKIRSHPGYLHAKAILVDNKIAWIGSVNGSVLAMSENREYGLFFNNPRSVDRLSHVMKSDYLSPGTTTLAQDVDCTLKPVL